MAILDWLKFFPFARDRGDAPKATEVRGPYFSKPRPNQWRFGDCVLHFKAPWANPILGFDGNGYSVDAILPGRRDILTADLQPLYGSSDAPANQWSRGLFYDNTWYFVGPWFTGDESRLKAGGLLVSADQRSSFGEMNLFHPKVFEAATASYLDNSFGYKRSGKKPDFRGPLNWRVLQLSNSIQAVSFDVHYIANGSKVDYSLKRFVFFPVSPQQFIRIDFDFGGTSVIHDKMRAEPMLALCNSIIDSMHLEVGPATQAEWDKVKATYPDMAITETFAELPWPLIKEKPTKKQKEIDITQTFEPKVIPNQSYD